MKSKARMVLIILFSLLLIASTIALSGCTAATGYKGDPLYEDTPRGSSSTLVVAAANASDQEKKHANYVCAGTSGTGGDQVVLNSIPLTSAINNITLLGDFYTSNTWTINATNKRVHLSGNARIHDINTSGTDTLHLYGSWTSSFDGPQWNDLAPEMHSTIEGIDFYGNAAAGDAITVHGLACLEINGCNIAHYTTGNGINITGVMRQLIISRNTIFECYRAIYSDATAMGIHQCNIENNFIAGSLLHSIYFSGVYYNLQIVGNDIEYCVGSHIKLDGGGTGEGETTIVGNMFDGGTIGVNCINSNGVLISDNKFSTQNENAVRIYGGDSISVTNNQIRFVPVPILNDLAATNVKIENNNGANNPLAGSKFIAASNATQAELSKADITCTGTADSTLINAALTAAGANAEIEFSSGTFALTASLTPLAGQTLYSKAYPVFQGVTRPISISVADVWIDHLKFNGADTHAEGIYATTNSTRVKVTNCIVYDYTGTGIYIHNTGTIGTSVQDGAWVENNYVYGIGVVAAGTAPGIKIGYDGGDAAYSQVKNNKVYDSGIGILNYSNNSVFQGNVCGYNGIGFEDSGNRQTISNNKFNHNTMWGLYLVPPYGGNDVVIGNSMVANGQSGIVITANAGINSFFTSNELHGNGASNTGDDFDNEIRLGTNGQTTSYITFQANNIGQGTMPLYAVAIVAGSTMSHIYFNDNQIANTNSGIFSGKTTAVICRGNDGYIDPGEIRTYSGTIATLTQNAFNSVDNPFGQKVRVLSLDIHVSVQATSTTPNLDCGLGNSATADYITLFDDLPGETAGFYNSVHTGTYGKQTSPQLWDSGSGNRYLNMSIKDAAATGMAASFTVTIMGN